jgi:hypothetical protein
MIYRVTNPPLQFSALPWDYARHCFLYWKNTTFNFAVLVIAQAE